MCKNIYCLLTHLPILETMSPNKLIAGLLVSCACFTIPFFNKAAAQTLDPSIDNFFIQIGYLKIFRQRAISLLEYQAYKEICGNPGYYGEAAAQSNCKFAKAKKINISQYNSFLWNHYHIPRIDPDANVGIMIPYW